MAQHYIVELNAQEHEPLLNLTRGGELGARKLKRAQLLLAANQRQSETQIAATLGVATSTIYRTKERYVEGGLEAALNEKPRPGAERKLKADHEANPDIASKKRRNL